MAARRTLYKQKVVPFHILSIDWHAMYWKHCVCVQWSRAWAISSYQTGKIVWRRCDKQTINSNNNKLSFFMRQLFSSYCVMYFSLSLAFHLWWHAQFSIRLLIFGVFSSSFYLSYLNLEGYCLSRMFFFFMWKNVDEIGIFLDEICERIW